MQARTHFFPAVAFSAATAMASTPVLATAIDVPKGNERELALRARGVQIYDCTAAPTGSFSWVFRAPEATLFDKDGEVAGRHYAGPTWDSTVDASKVQGTRLASEPSMTAGAIPQLLLSATVLTPGRMFGRVTYIQRVNTVGGSAPASGCDATTAGAELRVQYTASYLFYQKD